MYLWENPVLQRELLVNLRQTRGFVLLLLYQLLLALVVYFAWPQTERIDLTQRAEAAGAENQALGQARRLADMFFLGQYLLACMMAPSFAAGAITLEKERKTYEMLLASPLRPAAIVSGKLVASVTHLLVLIVASLPIIVLCLPLGGISVYEVMAAYASLLASVLFFAMVSIACSSYYRRTASALVVSYLLILPIALTLVAAWDWLSSYGSLRLFLGLTVFPAAAVVFSALLFRQTARRLLRTPDVGSEGKEVVDLETEAETAVGLVIQPDQFPDRLFAPPKRTSLMDDHANPVYDKEIRSEIFSQGTLMMRLVIQISILLALPLMAVCLFMNESYAQWYIAYVLLFNMLVGPVFSAGSLTSERERQTWELLLATTLPRRTIVWGKLLAGLRVSTVLTLLLLWPVLLAAALVSTYWSISSLATLLGYLVLVTVTCVSTAQLAMCASSVMRRTSHAMMLAYAVVLILYCSPLAVEFFVTRFYPGTALSERIVWCGVVSPLATVIHMPAAMPRSEGIAVAMGSGANWPLFAAHIGFVILENVFLALLTVLALRRHWTLE